MVSNGAQTDFAEPSKDEIDRLNVEIFNLNKDILFRDNQIDRLKKSIQRLNDGIFTNIF